MVSQKELLSPADKEAGRIALAITCRFVGAALDAIDRGATTEQLRKAFKISSTPAVPVAEKK